MGTADTKLDHQFGDRFRGHRATPVGVNRLRRLQVPSDGVGEEIFRHNRVLGVRDKPPGDVPGENVHDHVQLVPFPLRGAFQRGNVPAPHLTRAAGDQLGTHPRRMSCLSASLPDLPSRAGHPVHARLRTPVAALVQLPRPQLGNRQVPVLLGAQQRQDLFPLGLGDRAGRWPPRPAVSGNGIAAAVPVAVAGGSAVVRGPGTTGQLTRRHNRQLQSPQLCERSVHHFLDGRGGS